MALRYPPRYFAVDKALSISGGIYGNFKRSSLLPTNTPFYHFSWGSRSPGAPLYSKELTRHGWPSHRPTVTDLHQQASKITAAQKAWNVLGLIFGIAVGNSLGQM